MEAIPHATDDGSMKFSKVMDRAVHEDFPPRERTPEQDHIQEFHTAAMTHSEQQQQTDAVYQAHEDSEKRVTIAPAPSPNVHKQDDLGHGDSHAATTKRFLCWSLTKKKWIAAIVGSVLMVLLVVLLVIFLAIVPAIFQHYVDEVQLSANYLDIKSLSTTATRNEVDVELSLRVAYDASASSSMEDAVTTVFYDNQPFGSVTLPAQKFAKGNGGFDLVIRDTAVITDAAVFRRLSRALVTNDLVKITTRAVVKASAMGFTYGGLKLDRTFTVKAFANFADPKPRVNNITLAECTPTEYKIVINATLDNASQAGIGGVGALNLSVYHEQNYLGQAVSNDATAGLPRGPNTMVLELTVVKSAKTMAALLGMLSGLLGPSGVQFYIRGDHPNAVQAPLLDEAFAALNISMLYKDGLSKVTLNPKCDLMAILAGGR